MHSKLVWITPESEKVISYCARVSNPANQEKYDTAGKLLKYCYDNGHWSIFEMASMCVEIETSRAITQQLLRHKSMSFQEFSQRYADVSQLGFQEVTPRRQDTKNRQNSFNDVPESQATLFQKLMKKTEDEAVENYKFALDMGIAKESARFLLPLNTTTRLYASGTLRSWIHYLKVRTDPSTQLEHREIAEEIKEILVAECPVIGVLLASGGE